MTASIDLFNAFRASDYNKGMCSDPIENPDYYGLIVYHYNGFMACALYVADDGRVYDFVDINENIRFDPIHNVAFMTGDNTFDPMESLTIHESAEAYLAYTAKMLNPEE